MPIVTLKIIIEKESVRDVSFKHFLNHDDYDVYGILGENEMFTMVEKKPKAKKDA